MKSRTRHIDGDKAFVTIGGEERGYDNLGVALIAAQNAAQRTVGSTTIDVRNVHGISIYRISRDDANVILTRKVG